MSRKGKQHETNSKKFLKEFFHTELVFKLINTERMDFIVIDSIGSIHIIEAKHTKSNYYNPKSSPEKREQLNRYFDILHELRSLKDQHFSSFRMLVRLRGKLIFERYETIDEIPTRIEVKNVKN